jgi:hypothetical protein
MCRACLLLGCSLLLFAPLSAQEEEPSPTPTPAPAPAPASKPSGSSLMPLPTDFAREALLVVKAGSMRSIAFGKPKPINIKPYAIQDLKTGKQVMDAGSITLAHCRAAIGFHWLNLQDGFSFRVTGEGDPPAELGRVACDWAVSQTGAGGWFRRTGVDVKVPGPSNLVCEIVTAPGEEPWEFHLWTDRTTNVAIPDYPSGGALVRGAVRYATASTNVVEALGMKSPTMTGTLFLRDDRPVAAIERQLPGRILALPSLDPAERSLFVVVGAVLFTFDHVSQVGTR